MFFAADCGNGALTKTFFRDRKSMAILCSPVGFVAMLTAHAAGACVGTMKPKFNQALISSPNEGCFWIENTLDFAR